MDRPKEIAQAIVLIAEGKRPSRYLFRAVTEYAIKRESGVERLEATLELMRGQREDSLCALNTITEALRLLVRKSRGVQMKSGLDVSWDMLFEPEGQYQWFEPEIDSALAILEGGDE